jgi:hypothetical protein
MIVADAGNNRVMVWSHTPQSHGAPCDFVLGQRGPHAQENNGAAYFPTASTVNMPYGAAILGESLAVADTANSRLVGFELDALRMGANATRLAGQHEFSDKGDNRWGQPARDSLCWPYGISSCGRMAVIADSGNNRIVLWEASS